MPLHEWIRRLLATVGPDRRDHDLEAELRSHLELAEEEARRRGLTGPAAARAVHMKTGGLTQAMDALRDQQRLPWLDALIADVVFGWRQLRKHRVATVAAVFSLGLAIGATTAAFRLVDAVLLRALPVSEPGRLFALAFNAVTSQGEVEYRDEFDYPTFRRYRDAAGDSAQVMVIGFSSPQTIVVGDEAERAYRQYVSGNTFGAFGLQPALGRLLGPNDDVTPGGHSVAVISYDYWTRRFAQSPTVIGQTFRWGRARFEIIGVAPQGFTGTEPGRVTDFFAPAVMNSDALNMRGYSWFRLWVRPSAGVTAAQVQQRLQHVFADGHAANAKSFPAKTPQAVIDAFLREQIQLIPAGSGASAIQRTLKRPLWILSGLVVLVLAIACGNVANVLGARSVARAREMALRVSIGAGRGRLIQLVLIESALLAVLASCVGALFAWWAAPFVVSLVELEAPVRLVLDVDWRVLGFGTALTMLVACAFGVAPARRASAVDPLRTLKGSDDPHAHRRLTRALVGAQMAFCVFVLFSAGLFVATFDRLSNQPLGFSPDRLVVVEAETSGTPQDRDQWLELTERVRAMPGVESAALAGWAPLTGNRWTSPVRVPGGASSDRPPYFIDVSPEYFATMHVPMIQGRDFRRADTAPMTTFGSERRAGVAIVNATFARLFFGGDSPVGKQLLLANPNGVETPMDVVGMVGDAVYRSVREPVPPTVYVPITNKRNAALLLRTSTDPLPLLAGLRRDVSRASSRFRVSNVATQNELVRRQMVLERLIALLSSFFATVAVLLSAVGLYGVLNYAVTTQHREIGIRMALGARTAHIVRRVTDTVFTPIGIGLTVGLAVGSAFGRLIERLLFHIKPTDAISFTIPLLILTVAAIIAIVPPAIRALRIDPARTLRSE